MKKSIKKIITSAIAVLALVLCAGLYVPALQSTAAAAGFDTISDGAKAAQATDQADSLFAADGVFLKITNFNNYFLVTSYY